MDPIRSDVTATPDKSPACPACRSSVVTTTAKVPDVSSYWRCERCGEVWNVGRRHDGPRPNRANRPIAWR